MLAVYGFHPFERFASEIGKNLRDLNLVGVEVFEFTPNSYVENFLELTKDEQIKRNLEGIQELKQHIKKNYRPSLTLNLHETPFPIEANYRYGLLYPAWNLKLRYNLESFSEECEENVYVDGRHPQGKVGYHSATVEFYSNVTTPEGIHLKLRKEQGLDFIQRLIKHLKTKYLV